MIYILYLLFKAVEPFFSPPSLSFSPCFHCSSPESRDHEDVDSSVDDEQDGSAWPLEATAPRVITMLSLNRRRKGRCWSKRVDVRATLSDLPRTRKSPRERPCIIPFFPIADSSSSIVLSRFSASRFLFSFFFSSLSLERDRLIKNIFISLGFQDLWKSIRNLVARLIFGSDRVRDLDSGKI